MIKKLYKIRTCAVIAVCVAFFISFICLYSKKEDAKAIDENTALSIWQIDSFEGGKGSRAGYLQSVGNEFSNKENCYINVVSLSAEAARLNLSDGKIPDIISYGAGTYGIESCISNYAVWCRGNYCLLTLDTNSDFSDVNAENTVINTGKDNFSGAVALLCGLLNAKTENSTAAYVKLINGDYKYLLGTQRDIFRLKTRNVSFSVKALTVFNDLYQNISITTGCKNTVYAQKYVEYLLSKKSDINKIGMFCDGVKLYDDEMGKCENVSFEYKITYPINEDMKNRINTSVSLGDINMLKDLLK